jgi:hypothetical protein
MATNPNSPAALEPFQVLITGVFLPGNHRLTITAFSGNQLEADLQQDCTICAAPVGDPPRTLVLAMQPLPPGKYTLSVRFYPGINFNPSASQQLQFTVAPAQYVMGTIPSPPPVGQPFQAFITGVLEAGGAPRVIINGSEITVELRGGEFCSILCPPSTVHTTTFTLPPLLPGQYTVTVYPRRNSTGFPPPIGRLDLVVAIAPAPSYEGLWLKPSEPGWGLSLSQQGNFLLGTWFTYDIDGHGLWLMMPTVAQTSPGNFTSTLYRMRGPAFNSTPFASISYPADYTAVGTLALAFTDADTGTMTYTVNGITQSKAITRYAYASGGTNCMVGAAQGSPSYQDLWVSSPQGSETGWGVHLTHQGDTLFAIWFTFGADGRGQWLVMSDGTKTGPGVYSGALQRTTGPAFSAAPFDPGLVTRSTVGSATFAFTDSNNGTFSYTLDGISQSKPITRYLYSSPPTACQ